MQSGRNPSESTAVLVCTTGKLGARLQRKKIAAVAAIDQHNLTSGSVGKESSTFLTLLHPALGFLSLLFGFDLYGRALVTGFFWLTF